ncbi:hypothetical protein Btru_016126 [Bulinus truncatus]|nr:hypothetical protein Btru_016126 [Bulinus truncatus]
MNITACCLLLVFIFMTSSVLGKDEPETVTKLRHIMNGRFSNRAQVDEEVAQNSDVRHVFTVVQLTPTCIPALSSNSVLVLEEQFNGIIARREVLVFTTKDNKTVQYASYSFPGNLKVRPDQFNVDSLKGFTSADFKSSGECDGSFTKITGSFYAGTFTDCNVVVDGKHPVYFVSLSPDVMTAEAKHKEALEYAPEPYIMLQVGETLPIPSC